MATLFLASGFVITSAGAIGAASDGCGEYSFGFTGTRLLNDGISNSAGPFAIALPAGTYDITMWSNDNHPTDDYQVEQENEQWYFVLDNGYTSPPTADIPADGSAIVHNVSAVELTDATSISVHHVKIGGINSVNVECVGFTPTPIVAGPVTTTAAPQIAVPTTTTTTIPAAAPPTTVAPKATAAPPATEAPTTTAVPVEVKQVVEVPEAQLAVTGPTSTPLLIVGLALLTVGAACLAAEQRIQVRRN